MLKALHLQSIAFRRAITALLIAQLLVVVAMTVSPALHHWVHHDSDSQEHECAVTLFAHGGCDGVPTVLVLVVFLATTRRLLHRQVAVWVENLFLSRRVLEHAPPAA